MSRIAGLRWWLALALAFGSATQANAQRAWTGELEVLSESGPQCLAPGAAPGRLRMHLAVDEIPGMGGTHRIVAWGDFQSVVLTLEAGAAVATGRPLAPGASWQVRLSMDKSFEADRLIGTWQESDAAGSAGCLFAQARFTLRSPEVGDEAARILAQGRAIVAVHAHIASMLQASDGTQWLTGARALLDQSGDEPGLPVTNREVATLLLEAARRGWGFREREVAHALVARASAMLKAMGRSEALHAARAIRREAAMLRRLVGPDAGQRKLDEAVAWLTQHDLDASADMAALLSTRGAWWMQQRQWARAQAAFEHASRIETARRAAPGERALAFHNWASALHQGGRGVEAKALWKAAKELIVRSDDAGDRALLLLIEESLGRRGPVSGVRGWG